MHIETDQNQNTNIYPIVFKGSAKEYFRIWIVNTLLTVVTLGIYSAWAKVRKRKYFYRNTYLANDSFDYHADPKKILIGRIIIASLFITYSYGPLISPIVGGVGFLIFITAFPWLIVRGAIFNYRNTSYRNIRFGFDKNYKKSYANYLVAALATILTLALMLPFALYKHYNFMLNNISFGQQKLGFQSKISKFFAISYGAIGYYLLFVLPVAFLVMWMASEMEAKEGLVYLSVFIVYAGSSLLYGYQKAKLSNEISSASKFPGVTFQSDLKAFDVSWIYFTNFIAVVCTLGFATPWAKVRSLRYRLEHTKVIASPEAFNQFVAHQEQAEGHIADASADFWDIDFGL